MPGPVLNTLRALLSHSILTILLLFFFFQGGKKNFIQGKSTTVGSYNRGERLSLSLTPAGTQLGLTAKEQGGSMRLQRETGRRRQQGGCQWVETYSEDHKGEGGFWLN